MKLISNRIILAVVFILATALYSCQKENSSSSNETTVSEEDAVSYSDESAQAEGSFDDIEDISMQAADEEGVTSAGGRVFPFVHLRLRLGPCAVITVTPNDSTYPKTVTIDFPGDGCWCADGKHRKGTITLFFTGPIRHPGSVLTITLTNFYLNRAHIEGTKTISNLSTPNGIKFTVQVTGGKVTFPSGRGYTYESLKYKAQIDGASTNDVADDVYKIEGRSKTQFNNGVTINLNTETPLIKKVACDWISDGTLKIKINSRVLFLDFGAPNNGDCDNKALLTWNDGNNHRLITLP